jgi:mRNA interferase RelE/StbE
MIYKLTFLESAKKEWDGLSPSLKIQFKKKLIQRLENPHVAKDKLSGFPYCYKIKLRSAGCRLVYRVFDDRVIVQIVAVGKRDKSIVYVEAKKRIH